MANPELAAVMLFAAEHIDENEDAGVIRGLRDANNPFDLTDKKFCKKFRLPKEQVHYLCDSLRPTLQRQRRHGLSVEHQVLAALRFFARGSYQHDVGDSYLMPMSQSSVSRAVNRVAQGIYDSLLYQWVKFPDTPEKMQFIKSRFQEERNFKGVLGCVDGTLIRIVRPHLNEDAYVNHKGYHSLNVQVVSSYFHITFSKLTMTKIFERISNDLFYVASHDLEILSIKARFPGSVHDSFIWRYSTVRDVMKRLWENGDRTSWLLGDSGYPLEPWLMVPINHAVEGTPEHAFTRAHCRTRNCVERLFGTWKNTFRCILGDRVLHDQPIVAAKIVLAVAVLHNFRRHYNILDDEDEVHEESDDENDGNNIIEAEVDPDNIPDENEGAVGEDLLQEARRVQMRIIRDCFEV